MASEAGILNAENLRPELSAPPVHNPSTSTPGLPVKADVTLYQGCMAAYDPANGQVQPADPAMPATAVVIGVMRETVDNAGGAKGDLKATPFPGVWRVKSDGNLTAAHLYKTAVIVDDHTVGVAAGDDSDRPAGVLIGLDGDYAWIVITAETARRGPVTVTLGSTNGTAAAAADLAALKAETELLGDDVRSIHAALVLAGLIAPAA